MKEMITLKEYYNKKEELKKSIKYPRILVSIISSHHSMYCLPQFLKGLRGIDYPNMEVMIVDNSPDDQAMNYCRSIRE